MSVSIPDQISIEALAEDFLARRRRGERPTLEEYVARYPLLSDEIHEFFPVLGLVEDFKPATGELTGSIAGSTVPGVAVAADRLGDYRLLREIGRGGMGVVYEAEQESLGRRVALKVLRSNRLLDPKVLVRFHREAKAAARLHHTNIVPVFGVGDHDGAHFYVMQFIQGIALDAVLAEVRRLADIQSKHGDGSRIAAASLTHGAEMTVADCAHSLLTGKFAAVPLTESTNTTALAPPQEAAAPSPVALTAQSGFSTVTDSGRQYSRSVARVGLQVAQALDYAHVHGVLHRDIKPSNLLLDAHGSVWVTDFGLAKVATDGDLTCTGDIVGTVRYMAPERFEGRCDARADVYALGITLYELLTTRPAFDASDRATLIRQVTQQEPAALRHLNPAVPRDLHTIIHTAIAKDLKDRFASAAELRDELERFLSDRPIRSRPISPPEHYWRWCKRNPGLALASTLAGALTIAIAIVMGLAAARNGRLAGQLKNQRDEAHLNLIQAYASEADARLRSRRAGQRFNTLDAVARAMSLANSAGLSQSQQETLRNHAIAAMGLPDIRVARDVEVSDPKRHGFTIDAEFERYAHKRDDGSVVVRRLADNEQLRELKGTASDGPTTVGEFSPSGRYLAMMSHDARSALEVWDLSDGRLVLSEASVSGSNTPTWAFHADGRTLAFGRVDGPIVFFDLIDRKPQKTWSDGLERASSLAFSPDGSRLAVVPWNLHNGVVYIFDTNTARLIAHLANPAHVFHVAWNPRNPNVLVAGVEDNVIRIWDVESQTQIKALEGDSYSGLIVAFHPGGDLLASRGWNSVLRLWDIRSGRQLLSMPSPWLADLHFSRDGSRLAAHASGGRAGFLETSFQTECSSLVRGAGPLSSDLRALDIHPSGRFLVASDVGGLAVWDLASRTQVGLLPVTPGVGRALFDPSGAVLTSHPLTLRWPIDTNKGPGTIGPPELLASDETFDGFSLSRDGRILGLAAYNGGGVVLDLQPDSTRPRRRILPHLDTRGIAVSPDGKWVVTASHTYGTIKVWDARTGAPVHEFPASPPHRSEVLFSPDGRWLSTTFSEQGSELIETASWTSRTRFWNVFGPSAFSPDLQTFAFETYAGAISLVELATGREVARLDDPDGSRAARIVFSPDGSRLFALLMDQNQIRIWDLRAVRTRLARLGLDWSSRPAWQQAAGPGSDWNRATPQALRVDRGELDKWVKRIPAPPKDLDQLIAEGEAFLRSHPDRADVRERLAVACNNRAWELLIGPDESRKPLLALALARRAVALTQGKPDHLNTLGLALYRTGHYDDGVAILEESLASGAGDSAGYDLFILTLCHAGTGNIRRAQDDFDRARKWLRMHPLLTRPQRAELIAFRTEAETLLQAGYPDLPANVFVP